jgi:hypothetical protein
VFRETTEEIARKTSRRGLLGRGAGVLFGALAGVAAGGAVQGSLVQATNRPTHCAFPGPPCECDKCRSNGLCAKPCRILTTYYASGCWVTTVPGKAPATCCDCDCYGIAGYYSCGCGTDYHNNPEYCTEQAP